MSKTRISEREDRIFLPLGEYVNQIAACLSLTSLHFLSCENKETKASLSSRPSNLNVRGVLQILRISCSDNVAN